MSNDALPFFPLVQVLQHILGPAKVWIKWMHQTTGKAAVDHHARGPEPYSPQGDSGEKKFGHILKIIGRLCSTN